MKGVLVASNNQSACNAIRASLRSEYRIDAVSSKDGCLEMFRKKRYEFLFIDIEVLRESMLNNNYKTALQPFWHAYPTAQIIAMSSQEMIREAVGAVKAGASDYLTYPINPDEVNHITQSIYATIIMESELDYLRDRFWQEDSLEIVRTRSPLMKRLFDKVRAVASTKSTVLLNGETGTGKGVLSRLIHQHSNRKDGPFISVHCGAIPDTLLESELFGHERGAFTGAIRRKLGKFEIAQGGTIFLDEIGTITSSAQIKLLEILQDGTFHRVGGEERIEANVRVIAATNTDLKKMCEAGQFRRDLYYRLNVFPLEIPPLRERMEDIVYIVEIILKRLKKFDVKEIHDVHPHVIDAFGKYSWPGNIREMENLIERAYILEKSSILTPESFPNELFASNPSPIQMKPNISLSLAEVRRTDIEHTEKSYLKELLAVNKGRIKESAEVAGISTRQLHKLMKKYSITKEEFKTLPS
ncbi:MAG: sigma-54 dependent transcriptional regulator [Proteobacteria bacterium]|nr:sigma-54-dependent Fis family transcriptional regulator [Desulfobacteraceae bacterium]MBU3980593.1 sigma-54 dependent transcriptional regulator [Pseudomonadota bacterium]MBU4013146.1 sigma-54 dependent transcriptional regulator [Pseudomonadota bacterium]MBU4067509.1 sigma-54 dependent transcriptional regulator [Pseudomonadota bacterium]MBU4100190.1 sigma-54 dependent transcriptional regulator [Pseudomonadota bacterium]